MHLKKAVFPVAGLGTRFLPVTKATPKEMLPIVDKPLIQFAVEEACAAGIKELIFITNRHKYAIQDHFDAHPELELKLEQQGKIALLKSIREILPKAVTCTFIRQPCAEGLGHAVLCAKELIGNEPFAVLLADEWIEESPKGCLFEMCEIFNQTQGNVIALAEVPMADTGKYGIAGIDEQHRIKQLIEKPAPGKAPGNLAVAGRYILHPSIFAAIEKVKPDAKGEIQLTGGIALLLEKERTYGYRLQGRRFDCGSKFGYLQATLHYGLQHPEVASQLRAWLKNQIADLYP